MPTVLDAMCKRGLATPLKSDEIQISRGAQKSAWDSKYLRTVKADDFIVALNGI